MTKRSSNRGATCSSALLCMLAAYLPRTTTEAPRRLIVRARSVQSGESNSIIVTRMLLDLDCTDDGATVPRGTIVPSRLARSAAEIVVERALAPATASRHYFLLRRIAGRPAGAGRTEARDSGGRRYFARNPGPIGSAAFCARPPVVTIILPVVLRSHRSIATVPDSAESTRRSARSLVAGLEWASRARAHDVMSASAVTWPAPARCFGLPPALLPVPCGVWTSRHCTA